MRVSKADLHTIGELRRFPVSNLPTKIIYFLYMEGEIVYIGQSMKGLSRVLQHLESSKVFDEYSYVRFDENVDLNSLESNLIVHFKPIYNTAITRESVTNSIIWKDMVKGLNTNGIALHYILKNNNIKPIYGKNLYSMDDYNYIKELQNAK
jgi:hypothetical protein